MGSRSQEQHALLTDYDHSSAYSQAFYTLFANIRFHWENEQRASAQEDVEPSLPQIHTVLITSASTYKDQVTVAANLAIVAAQSGSETILVDADFQKPGLRQRFGLADSSGLSDLLEDNALTTQKIEACLQQTFVPGLRVLSAGSVREPGTALMLSPRLETVTTGIRELLASSDAQSGVVIYHCAPVLSGPDASLVGVLTEQTILTVIMGQTTRAQARQAQEQLQQAHIKLAGVIMLYP
ncbi:MAG TPA: CpsD/CapB family tyrosine-protein kinase [Ktedonobacteraceae bacterium]|nr:CpsD/CapB family tyrosine-protein kinase [Ktedonobacteraceae bacterium]